LSFDVIAGGPGSLAKRSAAEYGGCQWLLDHFLLTKMIWTSIAI
jgi:hypothetical protein